MDERQVVKKIHFKRFLFLRVQKKSKVRSEAVEKYSEKYSGDFKESLGNLMVTNYFLNHILCGEVYFQSCPAAFRCVFLNKDIVHIIFGSCGFYQVRVIIAEYVGL